MPVLELHPAELLALDPGNPVMARQPLVDIGEVGVEKVEQRQVAPHDGLEKQLGLTDHRLAECLVESWETSPDPGLTVLTLRS